MHKHFNVGAFVYSVCWGIVVQWSIDHKLQITDQQIVDYVQSWGHYSKNVTCYIPLITSMCCNSLQLQYIVLTEKSNYFEGCNKLHITFVVTS